MSRRGRIPGTRRSPATLAVLHAIDDELDVRTKNMLAVRNGCTVDGRCPACGGLSRVYPDPELEGVWHVVFQHEDDCPALDVEGVA